MWQAGGPRHIILRGVAEWKRNPNVGAYFALCRFQVRRHPLGISSHTRENCTLPNEGLLSTEDQIRRLLEIGVWRTGQKRMSWMLTISERRVWHIFFHGLTDHSCPCQGMTYLRPGAVNRNWAWSCPWSLQWMLQSPNRYHHTVHTHRVVRLWVTWSVLLASGVAASLWELLC